MAGGRATGEKFDQDCDEIGPGEQARELHGPVVCIPGIPCQLRRAHHTAKPGGHVSYHPYVPGPVPGSGEGQELERDREPREQ